MPHPPNELAQLLQGRIISLAGAGGKTSLLFALAKILCQQGLPVICTTTTKMFKPEHNLILSSTSHNLVADMQNCLQDQGWVMLGRDLEKIVVKNSKANTPSKLLGLSQKHLTQLIQQFPQAYWLIEADGAAGKPLKFPRSDEPVLPLAADLDNLGNPNNLDSSNVFGNPNHLGNPNSSGNSNSSGSPNNLDNLAQEMVTLVVLGLSGLGHSLQQVVHRAELASAQWNLQLQTLVSPAILKRLSLALLHNTSEQAKKIIFYNQADTLMTTALPALQRQLTMNNYPTFLGSVHAKSCQAF